MLAMHWDCQLQRLGLLVELDWLRVLGLYLGGRRGRKEGLLLSCRKLEESPLIC